MSMYETRDSRYLELGEGELENQEWESDEWENQEWESDEWENQEWEVADREGLGYEAEQELVNELLESPARRSWNSSSASCSAAPPRPSAGRSGRRSAAR